MAASLELPWAIRESVNNETSVVEADLVEGGCLRTDSRAAPLGALAGALVQDPHTMRIDRPGPESLAIAGGQLTNKCIQLIGKCYQLVEIAIN